MDYNAKYKDDSRVKKRKRGLILNTAKDMFHKIGIADTSMFDVAKATNIGRSTFYEYFNSKEELVGYVRSSYLTEIVEDFNYPTETEDTYEDLKAVIHEYLDGMIANKAAILFFFDYYRFSLAHDMQEYTPPKEVAAVSYYMRDLVDKGHENGTISKDLDYGKILLILETLTGAVTRHAVKTDFSSSPKEAVIQEEELHQLVEILFAGISK